MAANRAFYEKIMEENKDMYQAIQELFAKEFRKAGMRAKKRRQRKW